MPSTRVRNFISLLALLCCYGLIPTLVSVKGNQTNEHPMPENFENDYDDIINKTTENPAKNPADTTDGPNLPVNTTPNPEEDETRFKIITSNLSSRCILPRPRSNCRALIPRYMYDVHKKSCQMFHWGGCGDIAQENNFATYEECSVHCQEGTETCEMPPDNGISGFAQGIFDIFVDPQNPIRWYHSKGSCYEMTYLGSGGNLNNFPSFESCMKFCNKDFKPVKLKFRTTLKPTRNPEPMPSDRNSTSEPNEMPLNMTTKIPRALLKTISKSPKRKGKSTKFPVAKKRDMNSS